MQTFFFLKLETIFFYAPFLRPLLMGTIHQDENISLEGRQYRTLKRTLLEKSNRHSLLELWYIKAQNTYFFPFVSGS